MSVDAASTGCCCIVAPGVCVDWLRYAPLSASVEVSWVSTQRITYSGGDSIVLQSSSVTIIGGLVRSVDQLSMTGTATMTVRQEYRTINFPQGTEYTDPPYCGMIGCPPNGGCCNREAFATTIYTASGTVDLIMFCASYSGIDRSRLDFNTSTQVPLVGTQTYSDPCFGMKQTPWSANPSQFLLFPVESSTSPPFTDFSQNNSFQQLLSDGWENHVYYCTDVTTVTETNPFGIVSACFFEYPDLTQPPYSFYGNLCTYILTETTETTYLVTPIILPP